MIKLLYKINYFRLENNINLNRLQINHSLYNRYKLSNIWFNIFEYISKNIDKIIECDEITDN